MGGQGSGRKPAPCGTSSKYKYHRRRGEDCALCRAAEAAHKRATYRPKPKQPKQKTESIREYVNRCKVAAGQCAECGKQCETWNVVMFAWDHIEPTDKSVTIAKINGTATPAKRELVDQEIAKCQLLCHCCHAYKTFINNDHSKKRQPRHLHLSLFD